MRCRIVEIEVDLFAFEKKLTKHLKSLSLFEFHLQT